MSGLPSNYILIDESDGSVGSDLMMGWMLQEMMEEDFIAFDTETNTLNPYRDGEALIGVSFWLPKANKGYYIDLRHGHKPGAEDQDNIIIGRYRDEAGKGSWHWANGGDAVWMETVVDNGGEFEPACPTGQSGLSSLWHVFHNLFRDRPKQVWVGFNSKFDLHAFNADGLKLPGTVEDVMTAAHLVNENEDMNNNGNRKGAYTLKRLYRQYLGKTEGEEKLFKALADMGFRGKEKAKGEMWRLSAAQTAHYAIDDVRQTWELREFYRKALERWNMWDLYVELNTFHRTVLFNAEASGIQVDMKVLDELSSSAESEALKKHKELALAAWKAGWRKQKKLTPYMRAKKGKAGELLKDFFNPASPAQVRDLLRDFGVSVDKTDKATLGKLADNGFVSARMVLDYRIYAKAKTTYYDKWNELVDGNGILHPNHLGTTVTGRIVCTEPNLLQLPRKGTYPVKQPLVAEDGWVIVQIDYASQELHYAAFEAGCTKMINMLEAGEDLHQYTTDQMDIKSLLYSRLNEPGLPEAEWNRRILRSKGRPDAEISKLTDEEVAKLVNYELRQTGKSANFGLLYGMGYNRAMEYFQVGYDEAVALVEAWHKLYPEFRQYSKRLEKQAQTLRHAPGTNSGPKFRYIQLIDGRTRHYDIFHRQGLDAPYYAAFNFRVQGTCAVITRRAFQKIYDKFGGTDYFRPITMVYDSIVFYVREDKLKAVVDEASRVMCEFSMRPRLKVDPEAGKSWYALKAIGD